MSQTRAPRSTGRPARQRSWRRRLGAYSGALALVGGLAGACSSGSGSVEKPNLNVGVVTGIGAATFELGVSQKLFDQSGLSLNVTDYSTDAAAEAALQKGQIDIAFGDYSEFLSSSGATSLQVVGEGYDAGENTIGLVASTSSSLKSTSLSGTNGVSSQIANGGVTVDVPDLASPEYLALANWAISEQTPLNVTAQKVNSAGTNSDGPSTATTEINAVVSGSAGAAVLEEPFLTEAIETGKVVEIANLDSGNAENMPISGYFALRTTAQKDPNTIAAFQSALAQAQALGSSRVDVEAALTAAKVSGEVAATTSIGNYPTGIVAANLTNVLSLMSSADLTTSSLDAATLTGTSTS
ncbi:ABC transporter substrate-binding protein [Actinospica sp. MGRD01-02]|uniref:ABC transporter substrate-binding protein n=1 Tax=Actinospica acidithermotolerans TaxID=2828514 RepID=A0A941EBM6_9ACTN|nr:ABC transporter substrate-binding protein [Actinospica acidithermotolerans]MBR7827478.1 ABC transporter substrate-binding protein [Actinospica acidithermotolerans]